MKDNKKAKHNFSLFRTTIKKKGMIKAICGIDTDILLSKPKQIITTSITTTPKIVIKYNKTIYFSPKSTNSLTTASSIKSNNNSPVSTLLFIPCMNCGNNISIDDIEKHSMVCTKPKEEKKEEVNGVDFFDINFKIRKLIEHIKAIINGNIIVPAIFKVEIIKIGDDILFHLNEALSLSETLLVSIKNLKIISKKISQLYQSIDNTNLSIKVIIERAQVLISEKINIIRTKLRLSTNKIISLSTNKIEDIISDIDNDKEKDLSQQTSMSMSRSTFENNNIEINVDSFRNHEHDNKVEFYKAVLKTKFECLHSSHKGQKISQRAIYEEALRLKIPKEKWKEFILSELNNPMKYFIKRNTVPNMDTIKEEE